MHFSLMQAARTRQSVPILASMHPFGQFDLNIGQGRFVVFLVMFC